MTICELIERLTEIWEKEGNLEVVYRDRGPYSVHPYRVVDVEVEVTAPRANVILL